MTTTTPPRTFATLERLALAAHVAGDAWREFWPTVASDVARLAGTDRKRLQTIYGALLAIVVSGDQAGMEAPGSCPWDALPGPDVAIIGDTTTRARCLWRPGEQARS
jgi:hypothetical protein